MTEMTPRLGLPFILPGQAQKEMFHNEALLQLDALVGGAVEEEPRNAPPAAPVPGQAFIVGTSPTGAWAGQAGKIAAYDSFGWRFLAPPEGCGVWVKSRSVQARHSGGSWFVGTVTADCILVGGLQVVGAQAPALADPSGGATLDAEARTTLGAILSALRNHGLIAS